MLLDGKAWAWPPRLTVEATMTLGDVDGAPTIVSSVLYYHGWAEMPFESRLLHSLLRTSVRWLPRTGGEALRLVAT